MHVSTTRVRYSETDQGGVAYHANYLNWFEIGRTDMLRELGQPYDAMERDLDVLLTVVEAHVQYRKPAVYDERLRIETRVTDLRRVRIRIDTRIVREADRSVLCDGYIWLASVNREGRPIRVPEALFAVLEAEVSTERGKTDGPAIVTG